MNKYFVTMAYHASILVEAEDQGEAELKAYETESLIYLANQLSENGYQPSQIVGVERIVEEGIEHEQS